MGDTFMLPNERTPREIESGQRGSLKENAPPSLHYSQILEQAKPLISFRASEIDLFTKNKSEILQNNSSQGHNEERAAAIDLERNVILSKSYLCEQQESHSEATPSMILPQFKMMIWRIKLLFLARRLLNATRSFMFRNMSMRQFKQIDDKAAIYQISHNETGVGSTFTSNKKMKKSDKRSIYMNQQNLRKTLTNQKYGKDTSKNFLFNSALYEKLFGFIHSNSYVQQFIKAFDKKFPVFEPSSAQKMIWDIISILLIFLYTIQVPLFITFNVDLQSSTNWGIIMSIPIFVFFDILVAINTGCYEKGVLVKKRIQLFQINLQKTIIPNFIVIITYAMFMLISFSEHDDHSHSRWKDLILFTVWLKIADFSGIVNKLQEHSILTRKYRNMIDLLKLILTIMYISHLLSCLWVVVAQIESDMEVKTWAKFTDLSNVKWYTLYIDAFYFSTVTMITVGYGDLIPVNEVEKTICIIVMIFSCGIFAYSMSTIGTIIQSFNEDQVKKTLNMSIINAYMTRKNVSKSIKNQIREYLDFYWKEENERDQEAEEKIISCLSDSLKKSLLMESKNVVLKKSAIFRTHFSDTVKEKIVPIIREYRCCPQEVICLEGEQDNSAIYFIEKGSVEIVIKSNELSTGLLRPVSCLGVGESFGELSFFTGGTRNATIRSREFTTLLILDREEFLMLLVNHKEDYERFCTIRDSLQFNRNYSLINLECLSCKSKSHLIFNCPYSHFIANQDHLTKEFMTDPGQERNTLIARNPHRRSNSRFNYQTVAELAEIYQEEHNESIEFSTINALIKEGFNTSNYNIPTYEEELMKFQQQLDRSVIEKEGFKQDISIENTILESDSEEDFPNPTNLAGSSSRLIKMQKSQMSNMKEIPENTLEEATGEIQGEDEDQLEFLRQLKQNNEDETFVSRKKDLAPASRGSFRVKPPKLTDAKNTFPNCFSPTEKKSLFIKQAKSHDFTEMFEVFRQNSGAHNEKVMQKIHLASLFEKSRRKNMNNGQQRNEEPPNIRDQARRTTFQQQPIFLRRGKRFHRNNYSSPSKQEEIPMTIQRRTPFIRNQGRKSSIPPNQIDQISKAPFRPRRSSQGFNNQRINPMIESVPNGDYGDSALIHSNNIHNTGVLIDPYLNSEPGVEEGFDIMLNYKFYFPSNNVSYQLQLLSIPLPKRRSIIIWDSYQSMTMTLMGHSSQTCKLPQLQMKQSKTILKSQHTKKMLSESIRLKSLAPTQQSNQKSTFDNFGESHEDDHLRKTKSKHFTNHMIQKRLSTKNDPIQSSQIFTLRSAQSSLTGIPIPGLIQNQSIGENGVEANTPDAAAAAASLQRSLKYRFSSKRISSGSMSSNILFKTLPTYKTKVIPSLPTTGNIVNMDSINPTVEIEDHSSNSIAFKQDIDEPMLNFDVSFNREDEIMRQIGNITKNVYKDDLDEEDEFNNNSCSISQIDANNKENESMNQQQSSLFNCHTNEHACPNVPPRDDSRVDFNLRERRLRYSNLYDDEEEVREGFSIIEPSIVNMIVQQNQLDVNPLEQSKKQSFDDVYIAQESDVMQKPRSNSSSIHSVTDKRRQGISQTTDTQQQFTTFLS